MILEIFSDSLFLPLCRLQPPGSSLAALYMLLIVTGTLIWVTQVTMFVSLIDYQGTLKKVLQPQEIAQFLAVNDFID